MTTDDRELRDAARQGLRRAGVHFVRAGAELLAGVGAFFEEMAKAQNPPEGPVRIPVDDDDEDPGTEQASAE